MFCSSKCPLHIFSVPVGSYLRKLRRASASCLRYIDVALILYCVADFLPDASRTTVLFGWIGRSSRTVLDASQFLSTHKTKELATLMIQLLPFNSIRMWCLE